jgi:thiamine pyrophosphokinase
MESQENSLPHHSALIIANGKLPGTEVINALTASADFIICADGGANHAKRIGILPDLIIGDFDSVSKETLKFFRNVRRIKEPDQDTTDLEKSILYCISHGIRSANVIGASGDRIDHTTAGLGCFKKFGHQISLRMIDALGELTRIDGEVHLLMTIGEKLSLIPVDQCTGIRTYNLKFCLDGEILEIGTREGVSNSALAENVSISVEQGTLLLYRFHQGNRLSTPSTHGSEIRE